MESGERNLVITAAGGDYGTSRIIRELRALFPDAELKKRDATRKSQHSYMGAAKEDDEIHTDEDETAEMNFLAEDELTEDGAALWAEASHEAESALAALQQARRTLKDARQRQHNVKMSRQYFRSSSKPRDDSHITCFSCGQKGHRTANCPNEKKPTPASRNKESAPFVCFVDEDIQAEEDEAFAGYAGDQTEEPQKESALNAAVSTHEAMQQGKCVIDSGATRSIGSVSALESLIQRNVQQHGASRVARVDVSERPVFNFGNSSEEQCASTVEMKLLAGDREGRVKIHALNVGQGPILLSVAALRNLGAVVDYSADLMVLRAVDPGRIIPLERSSTGHQLLDLSKDLYGEALHTHSEVPSLRSFVQESANTVEE